MERRLQSSENWSRAAPKDLQTVIAVGAGGATEACLQGCDLPQSELALST